MNGESEAGWIVWRTDQSVFEAVNTDLTSRQMCIASPSARRLASWKASPSVGWAWMVPRDVFQPRAHLQREAEGGRQFRHACADGLDAEHEVIVGARRRRARSRPRRRSVRARPLAGRETCPTCTSWPAARGGVGREADGDDLRIGEADGGNRDGIEDAALAGDDLGDHLALRHGAVRQHRLAGQVADRPDVAHRRARIARRSRTKAPFIVEVEPARGRSPAVRGAPADGDQDLVGGDRRAPRRPLCDPQRVAVVATGRTPARRSAPRRPVGAGGAPPAASARRRRAAGSGPRPRRSSPWRRAWRRPCRAPARYSRRRPPTSRSGTAGSDSASVEEITCRRTAAPAARPAPSRWRGRHARPRSVSAGVGRRRVQVLPSTIVAVPVDDRDLGRFSSAPTPLVSRPTMPSFQAIVRAKSSVGGSIAEPNGVDVAAARGRMVRTRRRHGSAPSTGCSRH